MELLINDAKTVIKTYFSSILFGIPTIVTIIFNDFSLGRIGALFANFLPNEVLCIYYT